MDGWRKSENPVSCIRIIVKNTEEVRSHEFLELRFDVLSLRLGILSSEPDGAPTSLIPAQPIGDAGHSPAGLVPA